jgi:hypothetical protein
VSVRPDPSSFVKPADVWARAIIAAARVYGEDPVEALTSALGHATSSKRRSLPAACLGISEATGLSIGRVAPILALQPSSVRARKADATRDFKAAWKAAARAVEYAHWRPEAAESVLGSASGDLDLAGLCAAAMDPDVMVQAAEVLGLAAAPTISWEDQLAQAVEALPTAEPEPAPEPVAGPVLRPHAPLAGRVNLANGHAFAPPFRPGPPPPTQSMDGRILAQLAQRGQASARGLASILDIKEAFVAQTLRNLGREGRVTAADLAPGQSDRDQAWSVA